MKDLLPNILKVLNIITQIILILTAMVSMLTAYIVFAPDEFPKPFRLAYAYETAFTTPEAHTTTSGETTSSGEGETTSEGGTTTTEVHPGEGYMLNMSTKIINLVDPGGRRYIRVTVVVEIAPDNPEYETLPEEEKAAYLTALDEKLNSKLPIMDDTVITLLSTKTYEDLYTAEGKEALRAEILATLQEKLPDLQILAIYFTEFVVQ